MPQSLFSSSCNSFSTLFIHSIFYFLFPYLAPKLFCFHCTQLLSSFDAFSADKPVDFSFIILESLVLFFLVPYFAPKLFCFHCPQLLISFDDFSADKLVDFFFRYFGSSCFVLSVPISCSEIVLFPLHPIVHFFCCFLS